MTVIPANGAVPAHFVMGSGETSLFTRSSVAPADGAPSCSGGGLSLSTITSNALASRHQDLRPLEHREEEAVGTSLAARRSG